MLFKKWFETSTEDIEQHMDADPTKAVNALTGLAKALAVIVVAMVILILMLFIFLLVIIKM